MAPKTNNLTLVLFLKISLKCLWYGMYCCKLFECIIQLPQFFPLSMCNYLHFIVFDLDREPTEPAWIPQARCCSQNLLGPLNPLHNLFMRCITASISWRRWHFREPGNVWYLIEVHNIKAIWVHGQTFVLLLFLMSEIK